MAQTQVSEIKLERYKFRGNEFQGRDSTTTKDERLVNCYVETIEKFAYDAPRRVMIVKRPGITGTYSNTAGVGRGIWSYNGSLWYVIADKLYKDGVVTATTLTTTTGVVGSVGCTTAGIASMFFCDGAKGYVIDNTNTVTLIVDVDFPSPHVPTPVYIDGYVCIPKANSADIYNCDLETPTAWTASNFITAELFPDRVLSLARQNNQVVAFGEDSTQFFYDAANATGTPLANNSGAFLQVGTCAPYAIGQNERYCFFIGASNSGGRTVWQLDGFSPTNISTPAIDRILNHEGISITNATSMLLRLLGHFFYVIRLSTRTFVYDIDEKTWHEWTSSSVNSVNNTQIGGLYPINKPYINQLSSAPVLTTGNFIYNFASDIGNGQVYLLGASSGKVTQFQETSYSDSNQPVNVEFTTPIIDFDSYRRKFLHQLTLVGDLESGYANVSWSDNDYQTYNVPRSISLNARPVITGLGMFRRRNFDITFSGDGPFRLEGFDMIYSEGEA